MLATVMETPIGPIQLVSDGQGLRRIDLPGNPHPDPDLPAGEDAVLRQACAELSEYFAGTRRDFSVPLSLDGTDFQRAAWEALRDIPFGETRSYGEQAAAIGKPGAARAIGQANRANNLPIIIPCHRVLAADGGIGGYMGTEGAETVKVDLLRHEGAWVG